jgi:hypothetical protein
MAEFQGSTSELISSRIDWAFDIDDLLDVVDQPANGSFVRINLPGSQETRFPVGDATARRGRALFRS